ncbi:unnamed protein product [Trichogramma brassicae]|uniref:Uncharacterized protein n=1 Tax=Trichogramma brassicae TaxID=86971 RepID=A0A6H5J283_9HYME|nr:unnamed protein product [Trichogramma brassicae]
MEADKTAKWYPARPALSSSRHCVSPDGSEAYWSTVEMDFSKVSSITARVCAYALRGEIKRSMNAHSTRRDHQQGDIYWWRRIAARQPAESAISIKVPIFFMTIGNQVPRPQELQLLELRQVSQCRLPPRPCARSIHHRTALADTKGISISRVNQLESKKKGFYLSMLCLCFAIKKVNCDKGMIVFRSCVGGRMLDESLAVARLLFYSVNYKINNKTFYAINESSKISSVVGNSGRPPREVEQVCSSTWQRRRPPLLYVY